MALEKTESTITPEIDVSNLETSLEFYVDLLGFEVSFARPEEKFAYLLWHGAGFMIEEVGAGRSFHRAPLEPPYGRGVNFQIRCADVRALHGRLQGAGARLVLPLEERWYRQGKNERGNRQFVVADPDGYLLRFFEDMGTRAGREF
ncbi:MAG: VOC family protein [Polyangiaceae bacterium]